MRRRRCSNQSQASVDDLVSLDQSLASVQRFLGVLRPDALRTLQANWVLLVGGRLAAVCRLSSVRDGCMLIETSEPAVAEQLRWLATDLVAAANAVLGGAELNEISVSFAKPDSTDWDPQDA
jgi:hypothetical protein